MVPMGLLALCGMNASAQIWCPSGAHWLFDTSSPSNTSRSLYTYMGDTVIDGYAAQKIHRHTRVTQLFGNDTIIESTGMKFTRYEGDVVLERYPNTWDTLYWFGAHPGDEWEGYWDAGFDCPTHALHVLDTGTVVVDGIPLRSVSGEVYWSGITTGMPFFAIERIGGYGGRTFPNNTLPCDTSQCQCAFLCYADQEISYPLADESCELTLGTPEVSQPPVLLLYPDPGTDLVTLEWTGEGFSAAFMDATGRLAQLVKSSSGRVVVYTGELAPGAYTVRCSDGNTARTAKWIKQ